jgi:3-(3-hydroxy-phenyl)propionate hydroxylase
MELPNDVQVLIVGAGPVGTTLANLCGRLGVRTLMIDKLPDIQMQPRAIALDNEALRILQLAGLDDASFARVVIPEVRMHSPIFGQFARMNTNNMLDGHPMLITFFQPDLEHALHNALARYPSVQTARPVEWLATKEESDGCTVSLRLPDGSTRQVRTQFVVGADGASSPIRQALGLGFEGSTYQEDWLIVDTLNAAKDIDHIEFFCDPRRPVPHMPAPDGRQRWEFMLHSNETREEMLQEEKIKELLKPWADFNQVTVERSAVYRFHARTVSQFRAGRTLLIGDAAHVTPPFIGQGLVAGLRDAANLAWKLSWVVQKRADARILDSYHTERQPHARAIIRLAQWMGKLVMPRNVLAAFVSHGIARLITLTPGLRSLITDIKIKPKNRFARGLFAPRSSGNRFEHGNHLVQGRLRTATGEIVRSDDALGNRLQLIGIGVDPLTKLPAAQRETWHNMGGESIVIHAPGSASRGKNAWVDVDNAFGAGKLPNGWVIAVRPDKVVMADGAPGDAGRIVDAVAQLLR